MLRDRVSSSAWEFTLGCRCSPAAPASRGPICGRVDEAKRELLVLGVFLALQVMGSTGLASGVSRGLLVLWIYGSFLFFMVLLFSFLGFAGQCKCCRVGTSITNSRFSVLDKGKTLFHLPGRTAHSQVKLLFIYRINGEVLREDQVSRMKFCGEF